MAGIQPVAVYALRIPPGDILVPAVPEFAAMFRVTMAAIDPSAEPELEDAEAKPPRATLKVVRIADDMLDDTEDDDDYEDIDDEEDDSEDEEINGGPSEKASSKQKKLAAALKAAQDEEDEDMDEDESSDDDEDDAAAIALLKKAMKAETKGKAKLSDGDEEDSEDDDDDDDDESLELDEVVLCTLDPERHYQQPLDFVVAEGEKIFFKVSGTHTIHLTGNYVMPLDDISDDDEDDEDAYDLSPDEDELDLLEGLEDEESDELDDIDDPRIMELVSEDETNIKALPASGKGKNKRPAESDEDEGNLDDIMAKALKKDESAAATEDAKKLSKAEKKKLKKLKNNEGQAATAPEPAKVAEPKKETAQVNGTGPDSDKKKVQFAKNLEQGPTPSAAANTSAARQKSTPATSVRTVDGVTVDDRKVGTGPPAKKGSRLDLRYIGKLESGKQFDANKSGKPFSVKLGANEVIKGWEIGLQGITAGGERRITIPPGLAYGSKALPGIPKNSKLIFDIKCLAVK